MRRVQRGEVDAAALKVSRTVGMAMRQIVGNDEAAALGALSALPLGTAEQLAPGTRFRVVAPWVHVRLAASISAATVDKLMRGHCGVARAKHGPWLRVRAEVPEEADSHVERWVLTTHPKHGRLIEEL